MALGECYKCLSHTCQRPAAYLKQQAAIFGEQVAWLHNLEPDKYMLCCPRCINFQELCTPAPSLVSSSSNLWKVGVGVCIQVHLPVLSGGSTASSPMGVTHGCCNSCKLLLCIYTDQQVECVLYRSRPDQNQSAQGVVHHFIKPCYQREDASHGAHCVCRHFLFTRRAMLSR